MRQVGSILVVVVMLLVGLRASGAPFVNLNFEQAQIPPGTMPGTLFPASVAFPGWTATVGSSQGFGSYNDVGIGAPSIAIMDEPFPDPLFPQFPIPEGSYFVILTNGSPGPSIGVALSQVGDISLEARSLRFVSGDSASFPLPAIKLAGQLLSPVRLGPGPSIGPFARSGIWGIDLDAMQDRVGIELRLEGINFNAHCPIDRIEFSPVAIPEPMFANIFFALSFVYARPRARLPNSQKTLKSLTRAGAHDEPTYSQCVPY